MHNRAPALKESYTSFGMNAAKVLTENDDKAPRPTNVFMFGAPFKRLFKPSTIS